MSSTYLIKKLICSFLISDPDSMIAHIEPAMYVFGKALDSLKDSSDLTDLEKRAVVQVRNIWVFSPLVPSKREKNVLVFLGYVKKT